MGMSEMEPGAIGRRQFLKQAGGGMVTLTVLAAGCSGGSDGEPPPQGCTGIQRVSTLVDSHTHSLCVPQEDLNNPPAGGRTYTTSVVGHAHQVTLSAADLTGIAGGGTVMVTTTLNDGHTHQYSLRI
jgi:hypothetical protein